MGASDRVAVQVGGSGAALTQMDLLAAEFTAEAIDFYKPLGCNGGLRTDTLYPASGTALTLGGPDSAVTIPGSLAAGNMNVGDVSMDNLVAGKLTVGTLTVTGTSTHTALETFNGGIATDSISPASGTTMTIGDAGSTVTIPGNLAVRAFRSFMVTT